MALGLAAKTQESAGFATVPLIMPIAATLTTTGAKVRIAASERSDTVVHEGNGAQFLAGQRY